MNRDILMKRGGQGLILSVRAGRVTALVTMGQLITDLNGEKVEQALAALQAGGWVIVN